MSTEERQPKRLSETSGYQPTPPQLDWSPISDYLETDLLLVSLRKMRSKGQGRYENATGYFYLLDCVVMDTGEAVAFASSQTRLLPHWDRLAEKPEELPCVIEFFKVGDAYDVR